MALDPLVEFLTRNPALKPTTYVCGPMRNIKCLNFPMFNKVTAILRQAGFNVISPAESDRIAKVPWTSPTDPDWADENFPFSTSKQELRDTLRRDVESLLSLRVENGDFISLLPGWRQSTGAFMEMGNSRFLTLPTFEITFTHKGEIVITEITDQDWGAKAYMVADPYFPGRN